MSKIAVVILNWNGQKLLEQFLPSVIQNTPAEGVEIIVADNASTDESVSFLESKYPSVKIIRLPENFGFAKGYNLALSQIHSEYFVLLNSDVEVTEGWLNCMVDYLDYNEDVAAVQPKILSQRNKIMFEYAGASGGYIDKLGYPFCRGRIFGVVEEDREQYDEVKDVFWASGACMLIRSKDFLDSGGFDENFFAHMEEIDLCWRLKSKSRRIICIPQSVVYHVGGATLKQESARKVYLNFRNNMLMLYKNLDEQSLGRVIRERKIYNLVAALQFILLGQMNKAKAIFQAHKDFNRLLPAYRKGRENSHSATRKNKIPEIYQGNLIVDFYLRNKKRFKDLSF